MSKEFLRGFKAWCENTAIGLRRDLALAAHEPLAPQDLAKTLDVDVWSADKVPGVDSHSLHVLLERESDCWSAVTINIGPKRIIVLNSAHSAARTASNLSHELSHIVLGHKPGRIDVSEDGLLLLHSFNRVQENEANWLAGCLLLPRPALLHIRHEGWEAESAAGQFGVSKEMLDYRMNVVGLNTRVVRSRASRKPMQ